MDILKLFMQLLLGALLTAATYLAYPIYFRYIKNKKLPVPRTNARKIAFVNAIIMLIIYTLIGILLIDKLYAPNYLAAAFWGSISYRIMKRGGSVYDYRSDQEIVSGVVNEKHSKKKIRKRRKINNKIYKNNLYKIYAKSYYQARAEIHTIAAQKALIKALKVDQNRSEDVCETVTPPVSKEEHIDNKLEINTKNYKLMDEYEASTVKTPPDTGKTSKMLKVIAIILFITITTMIILGSINTKDANIGKSDRQAVKFPANGTIEYLTSLDNKIPVWIKAPDGKYDKYYIIIKDNNNKNTLIRAYLNSGETINATIPETDYIIYYATGKIWYGNKYLFEKDGEYNVVNGYIDVKSDKNKYDGYTIEIGEEPEEFKKRLEISEYPIN